MPRVKTFNDFIHLTKHAATGLRLRATRVRRIVKIFDAGYILGTRSGADAVNRVRIFFEEARRRGVLQTAAVYIVAAWAVLQAADVLFPGAGIPDSAIRFVFGGAVLGFPLIMVFGWMYDITARGVRRTPPAAQSHDEPLPLRRADFAVLSALIALALGLCTTVIMTVIGQALPVDTSANNNETLENSIAVLPFVNMSDDAENDYFADGISEELLNQLAGIPALRVAARTSSFYFKGRNEPIRSIGRQLGVKTLLEGSVRISRDRIRITAQLINAADGYHLWSKNFDTVRGDVFAIQEEIARAITDALKIRLLGEQSAKLASAPTDSFEAYDYYLLGQHYREQRNPESLDKSIELFQKAIDLDDRFAPAYSALALSYLYQGYFSDLPPEKVETQAIPLVEKALELDPDLANAIAARASVRLLLGDFTGAEEGFRTAIALSPNYSGAWSNLGFSLLRQSRLEEAAAAYARSEVLDPLSTTVKLNVGLLKMLTGDYENGLAAVERVRELAPEMPHIPAALTHWSKVYGRYDKAAQFVRDALEEDPDSVRALAGLADLYTSLGIWNKALAAAQRALELSPDMSQHFDRLLDIYLMSGATTEFTNLVRSEYAKIDRLSPSRLSPTNKSRYAWHGLAALIDGDYDQAIKDYTDASGGQAGIDNAVYDHITNIKYLAFAYQRTGKDEEARSLLLKCLDLAQEAHEQGWATPTIHYRTAQIHALLGDADKAIEQLQVAVDKGWLFSNRLETSFLFGPIRNDPRYQQIIAEVNAELARQGQEVATILDGTGY